MAFYPSVGWGLGKADNLYSNSFERNRENNRANRKTMREKLSGESRQIGRTTDHSTRSLHTEKYENHFQMHRDARREDRKPRQLDPVSSDWETEETRNMNAQQLYRHREDIMAEQDLALDKMLESAKRQRQIGEDIGTEAKASVDLIKRIDKAVENEDGRIRATTDKVEEVEESSSTKWFWLIICILTLALIGTVIAAVQT